ncbi:hypothetical protein HK174_06130, partial [Streptococcus agalactiae]|nr:hypothetical protein [Streptococcus agalactiae]MCK6342326.1 hypothetical protein [Streptococcus agalactiae]
MVKVGEKKLIAKDKQGNLINLLESHPGKGQYFCPTCCSAVRLKAGRIMRRHFAHISLKNCQFYHENESNEH